MPSQNERRFTHVCIDCGALGVAGGYHDHGDGNAGETIPLSSLPTVIRSFQRIENERDELREALAEAEAHRIRPAVNTVRVPHPDDEPEGSGPFGW